MGKKQSLNVRLEFTPEGAEQFKAYHLRATNTLEPAKWPEWLKVLDAGLSDVDPKNFSMHVGNDHVCVESHDGEPV